MPKGYIIPRQTPRPPEPTQVLVGCRGCYKSWFEELMVSPDSPRLNGPSMIYDCCSECPDKPKLFEGLQFVERIELNEADYDRFLTLIETPAKPNEALKKLLK